MSLSLVDTSEPPLLQPEESSRTVAARSPWARRQTRRAGRNGLLMPTLRPTAKRALGWAVRLRPNGSYYVNRLAYPEPVAHRGKWQYERSTVRYHSAHAPSSSRSTSEPLETTQTNCFTVYLVS